MVLIATMTEDIKDERLINGVIYMLHYIPA